MNKVFKIFVSLFLMVAFLMPSIVKLEHHHEHDICNDHHEVNVHKYQEKCDVCSFEFSLFSTDNIDVVFEREIMTDGYNDNHKSAHYSKFLNFTFQLRAPPIRF